jgi:outer membrane usher protein FimD/PapC
MLSDNYYSFVLGTGWNTPIGAVSVDATRSHSEQDNGVFDGQSYQVAWNKYVAQTGTQFALAAFRYSSRIIVPLTITFGRIIKIATTAMKMMFMTLLIISE